MKKLLAITGLSLLASALAGGGGPRTGFPLAAGQVWEMTYQIKDASPQRLQRTLVKEDSRSPDSKGVRSFVFAARPSPGESMAVWPQAKYLAFALQEPHVLCIAPTNALTAGYVIAGPMDVWEAVIPPQPYPNYDPTDAEVYAAAKKANLGTCTFRRLR